MVNKMKSLNRMFFYKSKIAVGLSLIFFSLGIWGGMQVQSKQSYFNHVVDQVDFEYSLAFHDKYAFHDKNVSNKIREVTSNRVQILTWDLYPLLGYPESMTSKLFYPNARNQERVEKAWDTLLKLRKLVLEEEQKESLSQ